MTSSNREKLSILLQRHLKMAEAVLTYSQRMYDAICSDQFQRFDAYSSNRERIINIIKDLKCEIDQLATTLAPKKDESLSSMTRSWLEQSELYFSQIQQLDTKLLEQMKKKKIEVSKEIGTLYKNRKSLGGYNLNSVR